MAHSHTFKFRKNSSSKDNQVNCISPGTVLQSLQTVPQFTTLVDNKTFIIERENRSTDGVIAEHFPCHLIREGEILCIHTFKKDLQEQDVKGESSKVKDGGTQDAEDACHIKSASGELITFTVKSTGGESSTTKPIVRIKKKFQTLCVYAYSDDTIEEALKRDGRFADIFVDGCQLHDLNGTTKVDIIQNVRPLHGNSYEICLPKGKSVKLTEKHNTEQKPKVKTESSTVGDTESESEEESTMTKSEKTDNQGKKTHKKSSNMPDFGEIYGILCEQFPDLVKHMKARKPSESKKYLKLRKEEFVQRTRPFSTMRQVEKLVNLGTSVCMVRTANMLGTGFLLFDNFILTNAHVIEESYNSTSKTLNGGATVNFNKGSGKSLDKEFPLSSEVFAVLKGRDKAGRYVDFALLKLQDSEEIRKNEDIDKLPRLLKEYTSNQHAGGIGIIGHPAADEKRMDVSCIVLHEATGSAPADSSIQVSLKFFPNYSEFEVIGEGSFIATYNTCFLKGSSGSPVFYEDCKLVAMHTGGFLTDGNKEHIIEFGIPLHSIIQNIMKQLASRDSLDVMFKFIETAAQNPHLEEYLKEFEEYLKKRAEELATNPSDRNAKILARICFDTNRNGMPKLSQEIHKTLSNMGAMEYTQQIQQEMDLLNRSWQVDEVDEEDEEDEEEAMQCSPVKSGSFPS